MIGKQLRDLRRQNKMTQTELAEVLEVTPSSIQKWECDKADPNTGTLMKIAEVFNCSIDYLFGFQTEKTVETFLLIEKIGTLTLDQQKEVGRFIDYLKSKK